MEQILKVQNKVADKNEHESIKRMHSTSPGESKKKTKIEKEKTEIEKIQEAYKQYKKESDIKYNELKAENLKLKKITREVTDREGDKRGKTGC